MTGLATINGETAEYIFWDLGGLYISATSDIDETTTLNNNVATYDGSTL